MAELVISSLRGGMNNTDPAIALPEDQCTLAQNVEYVNSMLGERRLGTDALSLPAFLSGKDRIPFLLRHLPTSDESASELFALGVTGTTTAALGRKTSSWQAEVTISDTPTLTAPYQYRWQAVSLHGKVHFAYKSNQDRLHVWDGTSMRRSGLAEPAAPTAANAGSGTLSGARYGRVRYTVQAAGVTLRRSEPSDPLTFTPSGSGASITWTKPATISEGETHWELELSIDNANFYVFATTVVGTTTVSDTTAYTTGYTAFNLSEDIGDYALIPSARYLAHDGDRLLWGGSWENDAYASRVGWTPVFGADGVGNDERGETDTDPFLDLDTYEHGGLTGLSVPVLGANWAFKTHAIYKLVRSGRRSQAYEAIKYTDALGAIHGSVVTGMDAMGLPCLYAIDFEQGPYRIGAGGIKRCGEDLRTTWSAVNIDASAVVTSAIYYPAKKQVIWCLAVSGGTTPTVAIVLHVDKSRDFADGVRKGWAVWTGDRAKALTMCLYADNVAADTTRSLSLVPLIGLDGLGLLHICDTGNDDNGTAYVSRTTTKPYAMGSLLRQFEVKEAALLGTATASAAVTVKAVRNFNLETTSTVTGVSLAPTASESQVIAPLNDLIGAEFLTAQFTFEDVASPLAPWELNQFVVRGESGQAA